MRISRWAWWYMVSFLVLYFVVQGAYLIQWVGQLRDAAEAVNDPVPWFDVFVSFAMFIGEVTFAVALMTAFNDLQDKLEIISQVAYCPECLRRTKHTHNICDECHKVNPTLAQ